MRDLRSAMKRDGYVHVPGVLDALEVRRALGALRDHFRRQRVTYQYAASQPNAAVALPGLAWLFQHAGILGVYRQLFEAPFVFTWHADAHQDMPSGWHRDDGSSRRSTGYFDQPQHVGECEVYKAAVYLSDHRFDGRGLTVQVGSHLVAGGSGEPRYVPTQPGDLIVFDVRIAHSGRPHDRVEQALAGIGARFGDPSGNSSAGFWARQAYLRARRLTPKRAVFFTFGADNELTVQFARNNMARQLEQSGEPFRPLPVTLRNGLRAQGVDVVRL